jgi:hypothetical protein
MQAVVRRLRTEKSPALLELMELDHALGDILEGLELLAVALSELHLASKSVETPTAEERRPRPSALQEDTVRVTTHAAQILAAFCTVRREVVQWNIVPARRSEPGANGGSSPDS